MLQQLAMKKVLVQVMQKELEQAMRDELERKLGHVRNGVAESVSKNDIRTQLAQQSN